MRTGALQGFFTSKARQAGEGLSPVARACSTAKPGRSYEERHACAAAVLSGADKQQTRCWFTIPRRRR